jgi:competence protein ComFC
MSLLNTILNIVFPVNCISCGKSGKDLCLDCLGTFTPAERETAKWIFPLYDYRNPLIKKSIWLLKYKGKKRIAGVFAEVLYEGILEELSDLILLENFRKPLLIPIPLSSKRKRERGFNQTELICQEIKKLDTENILILEKNVLIKPKDGEHQARIENRAKRLKNIIGSFSIKNIDKIKNRNIILIDDVTTTGATLSEAYKILKQNGAKKIIAFAIAH